jgi:catechol 2,3-dioxygenase-like lactoylglutathione lyase family enzyme
MKDTAIQTLKAHVALNVRNVERSLEFYSKVFGLEPVKSRPGYALKPSWRCARSGLAFQLIAKSGGVAPFLTC